MSEQFDWNDVPEHVMEEYQERIMLVESLLDDSIDELAKKNLRGEYCEKHGVTDRTIRNYLAWYRSGGPGELLFFKPIPPADRIKDHELRQAILSLVNERPTRTVRQLRRLLDSQEEFKNRIASVSDRTIYRFLLEQGLSKDARYALLSGTSRISYHQFQATHSLALVQGDARDGIWLTLPDGKKCKTYLFVWIDDYSRKILYAEYYRDEKLPRMEDSFKKMILRWGIPEKVYIDNGNVYSSAHFAWICKELGTKKIHHKPYAAYCKGKVEAVQKILKYDFQGDAAMASFGSLDELNTALWAWIDMVYNLRVHSSTGEQPNKRFQEGLTPAARRISDIRWFEALFLMRQSRTVTKYGKIKLFGNQYSVHDVPHGTVVEVRFNPFDLARIYLFKDKTLHQTIEASQMNTSCAPFVPEESKDSGNKVSEASRNYFTKLREQHQNFMRGESSYIPYSKLNNKENKDNG